jgi:hypothetical protein
MDTRRLYEILRETTVELRKGKVFEGSPSLVEQAERGDEELTGGGVLEVYMMPHVDESPADLEKVDVEFEIIGVNKALAEKRRDELVKILNTYPHPDRLADGPSYIEVGGEIGSQSGAFQLFALGKVLGFWDLITPSKMGFSGPEAREMAGSGFIMITGYRPGASP